jgi:hypothetical protein
MSMIIDVLSIGAIFDGCTGESFEVESRVNVSPSVRKEYGLPALGDTDTACKVCTLEIGCNYVRDLLYL